MPQTDLTIISAVNDEGVFEQNLLRSPDVVADRVTVIPERGHASAGLAYNAGLTKAASSAPIAFIHQDVYLPRGWLDKLLGSIRDLEAREAPWGALGVWGVASDGTFHGRVWCTAGNQEHVGEGDPALPAEVVSVDEIVIVLNPRAGLRFDEELPGYHLYATSICSQAADAGLATYAIDAPVIHNSRAREGIDPAYYVSYRYMQKKLRRKLPYQTSVVPVTRLGLPALRLWWRHSKYHPFRSAMVPGRNPDPATFAQSLGYE